MQHVFKLAAVAALCASAAAQAGVAIDANLENNTDFHKKDATHDSAANAGRVEVNFNAALAKNGDYFVNARGTLGLQVNSNTSADGNNVYVDDAWVQAGSSVADVKVGRFEAMDLFPLGKDTSGNIDAGNVGYKANVLRGRMRDGRLHATLGLNAAPGLRFELGVVTERQAATASYGLRPVVEYAAGPLTLRAGIESIKGDNGGPSSTGVGLTAGYAVNSSTTINANFSSNSKQDKNAFGLNAIIGDAGVGFVQAKDKAANIKGTTFYTSYSFPLLGVKGATITPALGVYKETNKSSDTQFRVRINYAF